MSRIFQLSLLLTVSLGVPAGGSHAQAPADPSAADRAFEDGQWALAIDEYRKLLDENRSNGILWLRIAQAQRELKQPARALDTLQRARVAQAPEAMVDLERARNLVALGQRDAALRALEAADHAGLRALASLEEASEFADLRAQDSFQRVYRSVRRRVFPCEGMPASRAFDFWVGNWEVRSADGTLVGHNRITRQDGGCTILEQWSGAGGSSGTSVNYFLPSRDQWRQVWVGSSGTSFDITGGPANGSMRLEGTIEYVAQDRVVAFRGTWTELPDGRVRQLLEEFDIGTNSWRVWFDGYYRLAGRR